MELLDARIVALSAQTNLRLGRSVSVFRGCNVALARNRGPRGSGLTAALVAGDERQGHLTARSIRCEHRAAAANQVRACAFYPAMETESCTRCTKQDMIDKHICMFRFIRRRLHHADALVDGKFDIEAVAVLSVCTACDLKIARHSTGAEPYALMEAAMQLLGCLLPMSRVASASGAEGAYPFTILTLIKGQTVWARWKDCEQPPQASWNVPFLCPLMCVAPVACSCQSGVAAVRCLGGC